MAKVTHRVGINGTLEKIFLALTSNDGLSGWWASSAVSNPEIGGSLDLAFEGLAVLRFRYKEIQENTIVELQCIEGPGPWRGSKLRFVLEQAEDQVFVTLTHQSSAASEADFLYFNTKWTCYLLSLRDFIELEKGRPYPQDIKIHIGD